MAKRKKKKPYSITSLPNEYLIALVPALTDRLNKLYGLLQADEIPFELFCQVDAEVMMLKKFVRQYGISIPAEVYYKGLL